jgi:hypothetical protein
MLDRPAWLPLGYVLDILDPDVVLLRREDGSMVGAFSTAGATPVSIRHAADRDMYGLHTSSNGASSPTARSVP